MSRALTTIRYFVAGSRPERSTVRIVWKAGRTMSLGAGPAASPSSASSFDALTVTDAGTVVFTCTVADEAVGVTIALSMQARAQP
jgi:hypothetical protein